MFFPLNDSNNQPVMKTPVVSYSLMFLIVLVFTYEFLLLFTGSNEPERKYFGAKKKSGVHDLRMLVSRHGLVPIAVLEAKPTYNCDFPEGLMEIRNSPEGVWLMVFSYIFLHGGFLHLIGNLWFFWIFADNVEERMGSVIFLIFFLVSGAFGGIAHIIFNPVSNRPLIGASGAIAGIMGAYIAMFPRNKITTYFCPVWFYIRRIDVHAWIVLGVYIFFQSFALWNSELLGSNVAFDAHLGGFFAGVIFGLFFRKKIT